VPAEILGQSARFGTLSVGKSADIIVVNGNPLARMSDMRLVEQVMREGVMIER
jgi:imidazolonepropionase-like amidohydrolase